MVRLFSLCPSIRGIVQWEIISCPRRRHTQVQLFRRLHFRVQRMATFLSISYDPAGSSLIAVLKELGGSPIASAQVSFYDVYKNSTLGIATTDQTGTAVLPYPPQGQYVLLGAVYNGDSLHEPSHAHTTAVIPNIHSTATATTTQATFPFNIGYILALSAATALISVALLTVRKMRHGRRAD